MEIERTREIVAGASTERILELGAIFDRNPDSVIRALTVLVAHGRETGAWSRAADHAASNVKGGPNEYCAEGWQDDAATLAALAGASGEGEG